MDWRVDPQQRIEDLFEPSVMIASRSAVVRLTGIASDMYAPSFAAIPILKVRENKTKDFAFVAPSLFYR